MVRLVPRTTKFFEMFSEMANNLTEGARLLKAILQDMKDVEINRLENEADRISRAAIAQLFEIETNPITLIKKKELYEVLETATDKAEDAANVIESVVVKSA